MAHKSMLVNIRIIPAIASFLMPGLPRHQSPNFSLLRFYLPLASDHESPLIGEDLANEFA